MLKRKQPSSDEASELSVASISLAPGPNVKARSAEEVGREMFIAIAECSSDKAAQIGLLQKMHDLHQEQKFDLEAEYYYQESRMVPIPSGTLLGIAAEKGLLDVVKLLLDWGAQVDEKSIFRTVPLSVAASHGQTAVVQLLLEKRATIKQFTTLYEASVKGHCETMNVLLAHKATVNDDRTMYGDTVLMMAMRTCLLNDKKIIDVLDVLLKHGAEINANNENGHTALTMIVSEGCCTAFKAKALLSHGATLPPDLTSEDKAISKVFKEHRQTTIFNSFPGTFFPRSLANIIEDYIDPDLPVPQAEEHQKPGNK